MNLKLKLPLTFSGVLAALMGAALIGIHSLNDSVAVYEVDVGAQHAHERDVADLLVNFKTQVQEWKDTLLRGKDPAKLEKHWGAFAQREAAGRREGQGAADVAAAGESHTLVEQFAAAHVKMGVDYRKGFDAFKDAGFDPSAGDNAVAAWTANPRACWPRPARRSPPTAPPRPPTPPCGRIAPRW